MSWVWPETFHIYLGQQMALVQPGRGGEVQALNYPATLPLEQVLERIASGVPLRTGRRVRLRLSLSAAWCPAVGFIVPQGIKSWPELQLSAKSAAAHSMDMQEQALVCASDTARTDLVAALPLRLVDELRHWAQTQRADIVSIQPLWAIASQCSAARRPDIRALVVREPNVVTLLAEAPRGAAAQVSLPLPATDDELAGLLRRWQAGLGLVQENVLQLRFAAAGSSAANSASLRSGPRDWAHYWSTE